MTTTEIVERLCNIIEEMAGIIDEQEKIIKQADIPDTTKDAIDSRINVTNNNIVKAGRYTTKLLSRS